MYQAKLKREERRKRVKVKEQKMVEAAASSKQAKATKKGKGTEVAPITEPEIGVSVQQAEMSPSGSAGITVIKCSNCSKPMKLSSSERPLAIKCPYCDEIGVIKE